ncbi:MAG: hypothetical protein WA705_05815 [Candidatus Ozemobacteraceae bacterium]
MNQGLAAKMQQEHEIVMGIINRMKVWKNSQIKIYDQNRNYLRKEY